MVRRWVARSVLEAQHGFRPTPGFQGMPLLIAASVATLNGSPALSTKSRLHDHDADETAASLVNVQRTIPSMFPCRG